MRIAYLTSQYPATSHTFIRREVAALRDLGATIDTFSVRAPGANELGAEPDRVEAERTFYILKQGATAFVAAHLTIMFGHPVAYFRTALLALSHRPPGLRGLLLSIAHFAESVMLVRELRRRRIRHLHNHFANSAATVGLLATRLLGIGWSFTMHGISETDYPAGLLLPDKIRAARMVVCVSWFGRAQGMRLVEPRHWDKFHVVRCGLPVDALPIRAAGDGATKTIICVGRLSPEKGQAGLVTAFARLREEVPTLHLRFVGDGPEGGSLEKLAKGLGLAGAVSFAGRLSEADTLEEIARADVMVLPSFMEGLPIVLMEAMAIGVPVVASRVAGIPELVEDESNGLLFTPANWEELATCLRRFATDERLCDSLAAEARKTIQARFRSDRSAKELMALFSAVVPRL